MKNPAATPMKNLKNTSVPVSNITPIARICFAILPHVIPGCPWLIPLPWHHNFPYTVWATANAWGLMAVSLLLPAAAVAAIAAIAAYAAVDAPCLQRTCPSLTPNPEALASDPPPDATPLVAAEIREKARAAAEARARPVPRKPATPVSDGTVNLNDPPRYKPDGLDKDRILHTRQGMCCHSIQPLAAL